MEIRINSWDTPLDHLMPCGHLNEPFFLTRHILPARYLFSPQRAIPSRGSREKCPGGKGRQLLCQLLEGTPWIPKHAWKYKRRSLLFVFLNTLDSDVQHWFLCPERLELLIPLLDNWDAFGAASQHLHFTIFPCEENTYLSSTIQPLTSASVCCHFEVTHSCWHEFQSWIAIVPWCMPVEYVAVRCLEMWTNCHADIARPMQQEICEVKKICFGSPAESKNSKLMGHKFWAALLVRWSLVWLHIPALIHGKTPNEVYTLCACRWGRAS